MIQLFYYSLRCDTFSFSTVSVQLVIHSNWFGELCSIALPLYKRGIQTLRVVALLKLNKSVIFFQVTKKKRNQNITLVLLYLILYRAAILSCAEEFCLFHYADKTHITSFCHLTHSSSIAASLYYFIKKQIIPWSYLMNYVCRHCEFYSQSSLSFSFLFFQCLSPFIGFNQDLMFITTK